MVDMNLRNLPLNFGIGGQRNNPTPHSLSDDLERLKDEMTSL